MNPGRLPPANPGDDVFDFTVLDETPDWIVVDKPAPLQIHPSKPGGPPTLWHGLRELLVCELVSGSALSIINRLDRETSGVVLIAKNPAAARLFNKSMMRRQVEKSYLAIVWGWPDVETWQVDAPLLRKGEVTDSPIHLLQTVHPDGAPALTEFRVLRRFTRQTTSGSHFSLLSAHPHTGRTHQIRVHLQHAGYPIVGDKLYGPDCAWYLHQIGRGWTPEAAAALLLPRQALHSTHLALETADGRYEWHAPLPRDLAAFCGGE